MSTETLITLHIYTHQKSLQRARNNQFLSQFKMGFVFNNGFFIKRAVFEIKKGNLTFLKISAKSAVSGPKSSQLTPVSKIPADSHRTPLIVAGSHRPRPKVLHHPVFQQTAADLLYIIIHSIPG